MSQTIKNIICPKSKTVKSKIMKAMKFNTSDNNEIVFQNTSDVNCKDLVDYLSHACRCRNIDVVKFMLEKLVKIFDQTNQTNQTDQKNIWKKIFGNSCFGGSLEIVNLIIKEMDLRNIDIDWNWGLINASHNGHSKIIQIMILNGANHWDEALTFASRAGQLDVCKLMVQKIESSSIINNKLYWNAGLRSASCGGHIDVAKLMISKGANNFDECLVHGCRKRNLAMINLMVENGADNWPVAFIGACSGGSIDIIRLCLEKAGSNKVDMAKGLNVACGRGHLTIVNLLVDAGAKNYNVGMLNACLNGHIKIVKRMIELGANTFDMGLTEACKGGYLNIANLMIKHGAKNN